MALAGAGGGGFLYMLAKEPNSKREIEKILREQNNLNTVQVYDVEVARDGMEFKFY